MANIDLVDLEALRDRVWAKVDKKKPNECWPWTGGLNTAKDPSKRYGKLTVRVGPRKLNKSVTLKAHRLVYLLEHASVQEGLGVLHKCHNTLCCNPKHLYSGTHTQNMQDMVVAKRSTKGAKNPMAKLHEGDIKEIHRLREEGKTLKDIAVQFDVHLATVGLICQGKTW